MTLPTPEEVRDDLDLVRHCLEMLRISVGDAEMPGKQSAALERLRALADAYARSLEVHAATATRFDGAPMWIASSPSPDGHAFNARLLLPEETQNAESAP